MKRLTCLFVLMLVLGSSSLYAQSGLKVGLNIGGQISSLRGFEHEESENKFDVTQTTGVHLEMDIGKSVAVVTAFNFERWKMSRKMPYYDNYGHAMRENVFKEGYDFYNIPLLIRYIFGTNKNFFFDGGGFMNYFNKGQPNGFMPLFINFKNYNFGVALGAGTTFYLNDLLDITLYLRNDLGLSDVNKYKEQTSGNIKTNTIRLGTTLNFNL